MENKWGNKGKNEKKERYKKILVRVIKYLVATIFQLLLNSLMCSSSSFNDVFLLKLIKHSYSNQNPIITLKHIKSEHCICYCKQIYVQITYVIITNV